MQPASRSHRCRSARGTLAWRAWARRMRLGSFRRTGPRTPILRPRTWSASRAADRRSPARNGPQVWSRKPGIAPCTRCRNTRHPRSCRRGRGSRWSWCTRCRTASGRCLRSP
jgi:hypothetical protein